MKVSVIRVFRIPDCDTRITRTKFGFYKLLPEIPKQNLGSGILGSDSNITSSGFGFFTQPYPFLSTRGSFRPTSRLSSLPPSPATDPAQCLEKSFFFFKKNERQRHFSLDTDHARASRPGVASLPTRISSLRCRIDPPAQQSSLRRPASNDCGPANSSGLAAAAVSTWPAPSSRWVRSGCSPAGTRQGHGQATAPTRLLSPHPCPHLLMSLQVFFLIFFVLNI
jgi:hypothetical protein